MCLDTHFKNTAVVTVWEPGVRKPSPQERSLGSDLLRQVVSGVWASMPLELMPVRHTKAQEKIGQQSNGQTTGNCETARKCGVRGTGAFK